MNVNIHNVRAVKVVDRKYLGDKFVTRCFKIIDSDDKEIEITLYGKRMADVAFDLDEVQVIA